MARNVPLEISSSMADGGGSRRSSTTKLVSAASQQCSLHPESLGMSWTSCAAILATYSVSSSTAFMPFIFGRLGYVVAPVLLGLYFLLCGHLQQRVCEIALHLPNVKNTPELAGAVAGKFSMGACQFLQVANQQLFMPAAILFSVEALKRVVGPYSGRSRDLPGMLSCNVVWLLLIVGVALLGANVLRRFEHAAALCKMTCLLNLAQVFIIGARVLADPGDQVGVAEAFFPWPLSEDPSDRASEVEVLQAFALFGYCYAPCFIATETMQEMQDKSDMNKALWSSTWAIYLIYISVGTVPSVVWGWDRKENVLQELHGDVLGRAANLTLLIASGVDFLITSVSLNLRVQELCDPDFDPDDWSPGAITKWFLYSMPSSAIAFLLLCFVPELATLAGLLTAFVVPLSQIIFPATLGLMAARSGILKRSVAPVEIAIMYIGLAVGSAMLVVGTAATVGNVRRLAFGGDYFCEVVAA